MKKSIKVGFTTKLVRLGSEGKKHKSYIEAVSFIQGIHYSPIMPLHTKELVMFYDLQEQLIGVITLGWGTQPKGCAGKFFKDVKQFKEKVHSHFKTVTTKQGDREVAVTKEQVSTFDHNFYREIGKMCVHPDYNGAGFSSQIISATVKVMKAEMPEIHYLYTMADGMMGKTGISYQASNFYYGGAFITKIYRAPNAEKVHVKSMRKMLKENTLWSFHNIKDQDRIAGVGYNMDAKDVVLANEKEINKHYNKAIEDGVGIKRKASWFFTWITKSYMLSPHFKGWALMRSAMFQYVYPLTSVADKNLDKVKWKRSGYPKDKDLGLQAYLTETDEEGFKWQDVYGNSEYVMSFGDSNKNTIYNVQKTI